MWKITLFRKLWFAENLINVYITLVWMFGIFSIFWYGLVRSEYGACINQIWDYLTGMIISNHTESDIDIQHMRGKDFVKRYSLLNHIFFCGKNNSPLCARVTQYLSSVPYSGGISKLTSRFMIFGFPCWIWRVYLGMKRERVYLAYKHKEMKFLIFLHQPI